MNKLEFLVRKLSKEASSDSADVLTALLCEKYAEYQKRPIDELKIEVQGILSEDAKKAATLSAIKTSAPTQSMSMNRSLTSVYQRNGLSLKSLLPSTDPSAAPSSTDINTSTTEEVPGTQETRATKKRKTVKGIDSAPAGLDEEIRALRYFVSRPASRLSDMAGIDSTLAQIKDLIFYPVQYAALYSHLNVLPPCGLLLLGPSGVGKTALAFAIAGETGLPFYKVTGPELIGGTSGESEQNIRELFAAATANAPSILFIDSLDAIAGIKESSQRGMDRRIIAQFFDCMDAVTALSDSKKETIEVSSDSKLVIIIAATNRADSLDPGLRGRFARELNLGVPDADARAKILQIHTANMKLAEDVSFPQLGKSTPGYVGADLKTLTKEAGTCAVRRIIAELTSARRVQWESEGDMVEAEEDETAAIVAAALAREDKMDLEAIAALIGSASLHVTMQDFQDAAKAIQPSAKREGFAVVPDVTWGDVGALAEVRDELLHNFLKPIANPSRFRRLGLEVPAGVIFYGPPGCGKTLLAKALANQSGANFISVKGPELLNMYVGESESKVRQVFARARASTPCMIFFDELDALVPKRGATEGGSGVSERVVNQFLTELDGLEVRRDVYIVAATNRLELIDEAMLRPGRLGKLLYVPLPVKEERVSILKALTRNVAIDRTEAGAIDLEAIGNDARTDGFSGADLAALVREAGMAVVREWSDEGDAAEISCEATSVIAARHFEEAFKKVRPSVSMQDRLKYEKVHTLIRQGMGAIEALRTACK